MRILRYLGTVVCGFKVEEHQDW